MDCRTFTWFIPESILGPLGMPVTKTQTPTRTDRSRQEFECLFAPQLEQAPKLRNVEGAIVSCKPLQLRLRGVGRKNSPIEDVDERYELALAKHWPDTTNQRSCTFCNPGQEPLQREVRNSCTSPRGAVARAGTARAQWVHQSAVHSRQSCARISSRTERDGAFLNGVPHGEPVDRLGTARCTLAGCARSIPADVLRAAGSGFPAAPGGTHGAFWRGKTRDQFVATNVFRRKLPVLGDGAGSTIIKALSEQAPFCADVETPGVAFRRMPAADAGRQDRRHQEMDC